jgi:glycosyltransferase 2 family protein
MAESKSETLDPAPVLAARPAGWGRPGAGLVGLLVSGAVLVGLYRSLNVREIGEALLHTDKLWLVISISMILPITVLRAIRFFWVAPPGSLPGMGEAIRLTLVASALNVFLPAKTGDLVKSYFVSTRGNTSPGVAVSIVVYERLCDLFALIAWCLAGWYIGQLDVPGIPTAFWWAIGAFGAFCAVLTCSKRTAVILRAVSGTLFAHRRLRAIRNLADGWPELVQGLKGRRRWIVPFSLLLWLAHLSQMWMFTLALSAQVPIAASACLSALALMAGQLPLTFAGLGPRDIALVVLLAPYMSAESAAAMGVLIATRNFLPPLVGMPMMGPYVSSVVEEARRWRAGRLDTR